MSEPGNERIVRRYIEEVWNKANLAAVQELFAEEAVIHAAGVDTVLSARAALPDRVRTFHAAFPDYRSTIEDMISDGDRVVIRGRDRGTQRGEFMGRPASGQVFDVLFIGIYRLRDGRIIESWVIGDDATMMRQLGGTLG